MGSNIEINVKLIEWGFWTELIWLISVTSGWRLTLVTTIMNLRFRQYAGIFLTKNPAVSFTERTLSPRVTHLTLNENPTGQRLVSLAY
jgi:hypothetical protein